MPPFISHVVAIIEGLLALREGVKSITLGYGQAGNLFQDIAAMISLKELAHEYFLREGFEDYELTTVFHQWMGGFPEDEAKAFSVIGWGASVAVLSSADKVIVKSPEAMGIPTKEANAQGCVYRQMISISETRNSWLVRPPEEIEQSARVRYHGCSLWQTTYRGWHHCGV